MHFHTEPNPPLPNCDILWNVVSGFFPCKFQLRSPGEEKGKQRKCKENAKKGTFEGNLLGDTEWRANFSIRIRRKFSDPFLLMNFGKKTLPLNFKLEGKELKNEEKSKKPDVFPYLIVRVPFEELPSVLGCTVA
jgi:hypothetical protein